jgi:rhamnopyranosyl-N-acetylglucosaminyl-diphospho-decaprenol beta-1,3/1,4-galactofuranosyltransferase
MLSGGGISDWNDLLFDFYITNIPGKKITMPGDNELQRVYTVIVSYNRLRLLPDAVEAVINQSRKPDLVIIVDNNSTDGSREWLSRLETDRSEVVTVLLDRNYGGAGGFYYGIKQAYERGADWIWVMDDDALPASDALECLLKSPVFDSDQSRSHVGFLASRVNWTDGSPHLMNTPESMGGTTPCDIDKSGIRRIAKASFVSLLINRVAVREVGYPIKEFFIHSDDVEYTLRITSSGFSAFFVPASQVRHLTSANRGVRLDDLDVTPENLVRWEYTIRNFVAVARRRRLGWFREPVRLIYLFVQMIRNGLPIRIQLALLSAGIKGVFWNYEKFIEYPSDDLPCERR